MFYKRKYKKYMTEHFSPRDCYDELSEKLGFQEEKGTMKKKGLWIGIGGVAAVAAVAACVIVWNPNKASDPTAMLTMDVNPSITFTLDKNQRVVSVNGENDEGKMVIAGETIVGKDVQTAIEIVIEAQSKTGFLVSGNVEANQNEMTFSLSVDGSEMAEKLKQKVSYAVSEACDRLQIEEKIEYVEDFSREKLEERAMAMDDTLTKEDVSKMSNEQLLAVIAKGHLETAELYSAELVELYQSAKSYEIQFAEKEEVKNAIQSADKIYQTFLTSYQSVLDSLQGAMEQLETLRYESFIAPESDYQKALEELKAKKADVLEIRNQLAALDPEKDTVKIVELKARLTIAETALQTAESALESYRSAAYFMIDSKKAMVQSILDSLTALEEKFPSSIADILEKNVKKAEEKLNETKSKFFQEFEKEYSDDIQEVKNKTLEWKAQLEAKIQAK